MKITPLLIILISVSACVSNNTVPDSATKNSEPNLSLKAFEDICIITAPSFSGAKAAAIKYGVANIQDMGFAHIGMTKDQNLSVQIKQNNECTITTPSQEISSLTKEFLLLVSRHSNTTPSNRVPTKTSINGTTFIFQHDRKGGEAFVMLKANS